MRGRRSARLEDTEHRAFHPRPGPLCGGVPRSHRGTPLVAAWRCEQRQDSFTRLVNWNTELADARIVPFWLPWAGPAQLVQEMEVGVFSRQKSARSRDTVGGARLQERVRPINFAIGR